MYSIILSTEWCDILYLSKVESDNSSYDIIVHGIIALVYHSSSLC